LGFDCDFALVDAGFSDPVRRGAYWNSEQMIVIECAPEWSPATSDKVAERLDSAWARAAFRQEAHSISIDDSSVRLDFVTW
jgi:hypothetical protein